MIKQNKIWRLLAKCLPARGLTRVCFGVLIGLGAFALNAHAQDCTDTPEGRICKVPQAIAAGAMITNDVQRDMGLITVNGGCSGTLLNRSWILTARHCVTSNAKIDGWLPAPNSVNVTATWSATVGVVDGFYDFHVNSAPGSPRDRDMILLHLGTDFGPVNSQRIYTTIVRNGSSTTFSGKLAESDTVTQYGRGYSDLAVAMPAPSPASQIGTYRSAQFKPSYISDTHYSLVMNTSNQSGHGGDSGGPSFVTINGVAVGVAGVQSTCSADYVPNAPKPKDSELPDWQWATNIKACRYVSTAPFITEISQVIRGGNTPQYGWQDWFRISDAPATPRSPVTGINTNRGGIELFSVGGDGYVYNTAWATSTGWKKKVRVGDLQLPAGAQVTALQTRPDWIDIFAVGKDGYIYTTFRNKDEAWQKWFRITELQAPPGAPVTAQRTRNEWIDIFVTGRDGGIYTAFWEPKGGWTKGFRIAEQLQAPPGAPITALMKQPEWIDLFVVTKDGSLSTTFWEPKGGWQKGFRISDLTAPPGAPVTAMLTRKDWIDVFLVGNDGRIHSTFFNPQSGWVKSFVTGKIEAAPGSRVTATKTRDEWIDLFVTGRDGAVLTTFWSKAGGWTDGFRLKDLTSTAGSPVTALLTRPEWIDVFVPGNDGSVQSIFFRGQQ